MEQKPQQLWLRQTLTFRLDPKPKIRVWWQHKQSLYSNTLENIQSKQTKKIHDACAKFTHQILYNNVPKSKISRLKMPRSCTTANLGLHKYPKHKKFKRTYINTMPEVYDCIPDKLRKVQPKIFKKKLKKITLRRWNLKLRLPRTKKYTYCESRISKLLYMLIKLSYRKISLK